MAEDLKITGRIKEFLNAHKVGRLGTADARGQPHVVPICYTVGEERIYSVIDDKPKRQTGRPLKRLRNIQENPRVCLTVDHYSDDWSQLGFVMVHGAASIIYEGTEHQNAADLLRQRYHQYRDMDMADRAILVIRPGKAIAWGKV